MVTKETMCDFNPRETYQWLWKVTDVNPKGKERVPMEVGDEIILCISDDGKVRYTHRTAKDPKNTELWNNACAIFCAETGIIVGSFKNGNTFKMELGQGPKGPVIKCNHRRNPDQGDWEGDVGGNLV